MKRINRRAAIQHTAVGLGALAFQPGELPANPEDIKDERQRADGYGIVRFHKKSREITLECWPRFSDAREGDAAQFPGWPITVTSEANDGRAIAGYLPELVIEGSSAPVVQVIEEGTGEILYTVRIRGNRFQPRVYSTGQHTVKLGVDKPDSRTLTGLAPNPRVRPQSARSGCSPVLELAFLNPY